MRKFKKILKAIGVVLSFSLIILYVLFYRFSTPKSNEFIKNEFSEEGIDVFIRTERFENFDYRVINVQNEIDTLKPTIVFVHGSIGSSRDFKGYLSDSVLLSKANLIAYDRVGYGIFNTGNVQESIAFEADLLNDLIKPFNSEKLILVGYSYGGPIVLALKKKVKKVVLLAPAVYSKVEPMPWALNLYKWKLTRLLVPKTWKAASKEKLSHKQDLLKFQNNWNENESDIISIHGRDDWIVPFENSGYLESKFPKKQFALIPLENSGHGLVWTNFDDIKKVLVKQLN